MKMDSDSSRFFLFLEIILIILSVSLFIIFIAFGGYLLENNNIIPGIIMMICAAFEIIPCVIFSIKIEQVAGFYHCKNCDNFYIPAYKSVFLAPHMGWTRYMKCPKCNKKSWQKKVIK